MTAHYLPRLAEVARAVAELLSTSDPVAVERLIDDIMDAENLADELRDTHPEVADQLDEVRSRALAHKFKLVDGIDQPYQPR